MVAAHIAAENHELRLALTFDYSQRAAKPEIAAASIQAARLGVPHQVVNLRWLGDLSETALTNIMMPLPHLSSADLDVPSQTAASAAAVWVPNRNAVFLMVAASYAEALDCASIVAGFNAEEADTFPDNSQEFVASANGMLQYSAANSPTIICPTLQMNKVDMVNAAIAGDMPLDAIYSCYGSGPWHCWQCESCLRLRRALQSAGVWETLGPQL